jgi:hypothetical protein
MKPSRTPQTFKTDILLINVSQLAGVSFSVHIISKLEQYRTTGHLYYLLLYQTHRKLLNHLLSWKSYVIVVGAHKLTVHISLQKWEVSYDGNILIGPFPKI